jgi:gamma-glutamyltranspeptidase
MDKRRGYQRTSQNDFGRQDPSTRLLQVSRVGHRLLSFLSGLSELTYSATFANADHGTSNITAADSSGLMCSVTTTVGLPWGSGIIVPKWGLVLNDTMDDFSIEGRPNGFGYEPSPTNIGTFMCYIYIVNPLKV